MTTSYKPPQAGASVTFLSSAVKTGQRNTHQINSNHQIAVISKLAVLVPTGMLITGFNNNFLNLYSSLS